MLSRKLARIGDKTIALDGLVGYWNYKSGVDGSIWRNLALTTSGTLNGIINQAILQNNGMYFDDVNSRVGIQGEIITGINTGYTLEVMFQPEVQPHATNQLLYGIGIYDARTKIIIYTNDNKVTVGIRDDTVSQLTMAGYYEPNVRHHITIKYEPKEVSGTGWNQFVWYEDGVRQPTSTYITNTSGFNVKDLYFGGHSTAGTYKGLIQLVRVYNRILTDKEIADNFAMGEAVGLG